MQVKRIIPKYVLPVTLAAMTFVKVASAQPAQLQDRFGKIEPKTEIVSSTDQNKTKKSWKPHLFSVGALLVLLGVIKAGDIIDKIESRKEESEIDSDEPNK